MKTNKYVRPWYHWILPWVHLARRDKAYADSLDIIEELTRDLDKKSAEEAHCKKFTLCFNALVEGAPEDNRSEVLTVYRTVEGLYLVKSDNRWIVATEAWAAVNDLYSEKYGNMSHAEWNELFGNFWKTCIHSKNETTN